MTGNFSSQKRNEYYQFFRLYIDDKIKVLYNISAVKELTVGDREICVTLITITGAAATVPPLF